MYFLCPSTETKLRSLLMRQRENETVSDALTRTVLSLNANINRHSIQNALKHSDLTWPLFKVERKWGCAHRACSAPAQRTPENKLFLMERLQHMLNLSKVQSLDVYDSMKCRVPDVLDQDIKEFINDMHRILYKGFLLKCMLCTVLCVLFEYFLCLLLSLNSDRRTVRNGTSETGYRA